MRFRVVAIHHTIRPCTTLVPEVMTVEVGGLVRLDFENSKLSQLRAIIIHVYSTAMLSQAFRKKLLCACIKAVMATGTNVYACSMTRAGIPSQNGQFCSIGILRK